MLNKFVFDIEIAFNSVMRANGVNNLSITSAWLPPNYTLKNLIPSSYPPLSRKLLKPLLRAFRALIPKVPGVSGRPAMVKYLSLVSFEKRAVQK